MFHAKRAGATPNVSDFTGLPNGLNQSAAHDINTESSPFSIFILLFRQIFQTTLGESNRYFHQYMATQDTTSPSNTTT
jgi:hypothetical protein